MSTLHLSRRELLATSAVVAGGLVLGLGPGRRLLAATSGGSAVLNPFLEIATDGMVTVVAKHDEMGQGIHTTLAMLVAEELEADWRTVRVRPAPADPAYNHNAYGAQITGGSSSTWSAYPQMRQAGAAAREMLLAAAAARWGVEASGLKAEQGFVLDASGRKLSFGELAVEAARQPVPASPTLKDPKNFRLIGKNVHRLDSRDKVTGKALFSLDTKVPGMLVAMVARSPTFGGTVKRFDAGKALAMRGVRAVVEVPSGVAVVAQSYWHARQARAALAIEWDEGAGAGLDTEALRGQFAALAQQPGLKAKSEGNAEAALEQAAKRLEAVYEVPYLAHAPMEPLSCLVTLIEGTDGALSGAELVAGSQMLGGDRAAAAAVLGLAPEQVRFENTYLGGGFGRRANPRADFVSEATHVAKAARHLKAPIKTVWSREDDIRGGSYRPMWLSSLAAGLDGEGRLLAWRHRLVGQSIVAGTPFEAFMVKDGIDSTSVEGAANLPYLVPNLQVELHTPVLPVTTQWWRSVGHSHTGFATEAFLDEVAEAAGQDPYRFRRALLAEHPRHLRVLDLAAHKSGWGEPLPAGRGRGIAVHESFGSFVAQVAEVSLDAESGQPKVHRVVVAIDCGPVVNPDTVRAQMESGIVYALSAVLHGEITLAGGKVRQSNFHDYPVVRMNESPQVEVSIVASQEAMGGVGEVAVPPLAAAVANALFAITGKRVRRLPIRL